MPRQFPSTDFEVIGSSCLVEEEKWEWYNPEEFYPVRIGEVFKSQYQVVGGMTRLVPRGYAGTYCESPTLTLTLFTTLLGATNMSP